MQHITTLLLAGGLMTATLLHAQTTQKEEKKEITLEKKEGAAKEKMVIEIEGNKITINGKPAEEYDGKRVIVTDDMVIMNKTLKAVSGAQSLGTMDWKGDERPLLGVISEKDPNGVKLNSVTKGSGAEKAGLKTGDIITKVDDVEIKSADDLTKAINKKKPGDEVDLTYLRGGKSRKVKATLGKASNTFAFSDNNFDFNFESPRTYNLPPFPPEVYRFRDNLRGMAIRTDRPRYGMSIQDDEDGRGVKVTGVEMDSNAEKAGLKENDIITEIAGKPVKDVDTAREILNEKQEEISLGVKVLRNGKTENLTIKVPRKLKTANL